MKDDDLIKIGIEIVEDGTMIKKYRSYYYNGIELDISHVDISKISLKKIVSLIFEAGKTSKTKEFLKVLQLDYFQKKNLNYE